MKTKGRSGAKVRLHSPWERKNLKPSPRIVKTGKGKAPRTDNRPFHKRHKKGIYYLSNIFWGTVFFVVPYLLYISPLPDDFEKYMVIFSWNIFAGILGSIWTRAWTGYWGGLKKTSRQLYITFIQSFLYSTLIFFGALAMLFDAYDVDITSFREVFDYMLTEKFWELVFILFIIKVFVFLISDYVANRLIMG